MTSPADADAPAPAQRDADSGWRTKIALGVVAFILIVEFVLPGFVAAGFSRSNRLWSYSWHGMVNWDADLFAPGTSWSSLSPGEQAQFCILAPSGWLMKHSQIIRDFYGWEFFLAGGQD